MALPISTSATDNIQTLGDRPNQTDGLTAAQLKIRFDQYAIDNENYNKNILIPGINLISSEKDTNLNSHKTSSDHDGRYFTEAELVNGALDTLYAQLSTTYTKSQVDAIVAGVILGQIGDGSITDVKLSNAVGDIKERLSSSLAEKANETDNARNTTSKTVTGAINELFLNANNGKQNWVDVVGTPLVNTDAFATLKSKTQTLKNTMATNLTSKGQSSVGTESLTSLIGKIANVNTGKGFASSTIAGTFGNSWTKTVTISGLPFIPKFIILVYYANSNPSYSIVTFSSLIKNANTSVLQWTNTTDINFSPPSVLQVTTQPTTNAFTVVFSTTAPSAAHSGLYYIALENLNI